MSFCPLDYRYGDEDFKRIWSELGRHERQSGHMRGEFASVMRAKPKKIGEKEHKSNITCPNHLHSSPSPFVHD